MAISNYVIRRGQFYAWRRVWRGKAVQIPLSTTDPTRARRLASVATAAASVGCGFLDAGRISIHDMREGIQAAIQREMLALDYEEAGGDPENARLGGHAFFFFFVNKEEPDEEPEPPRKPHARSAATETPVRLSPDPNFAPSMPSGQSHPIKTVEQPKRAAQTPKTAAGASPLIMDAVQRLSRVHRRTGRASDKSIEQFAGIAALFVEITGIDDVRAVRQYHVAAFVDAMDRLPPTYRRSAAEREKPIAAIIAEAKATGAETGLSAATVNRNLIQLGKVFKSAQSEGIRVDPSVNPSLLRRFEKKNAKDDRDPFTPDDVSQIFAAPVWTGAKSEKRRRIPGEIVVKDWLYWVPLIAAYTGARRERSAGWKPPTLMRRTAFPFSSSGPTHGAA